MKIEDLKSVFILSVRFILEINIVVFFIVCCCFFLKFGSYVIFLVVFVGRNEKFIY